VGCLVRLTVGSRDGLAVVGCLVRLTVGSRDGLAVVGCLVRLTVGSRDGLAEGASVVDDSGALVGSRVIGALVESRVIGALVGYACEVSSVVLVALEAED
jgi:hypothetical protein